ncbi:signal peptidase I [Paenibacillus hexagrammi]|uniref:Signal peptidase I n=1 Tax=Paenibacillus hexagrammi TaxID=2908839 RepID=A0ABY3SGK9_9BACL|nr:signal peptidase I [Paenibacillus sp. YPD9-1]UJF32987.1 signal peptidase I [Paenibacillus sp. YPD9-1]
MLINNMIGLTRVSGNSMNPTLQNSSIVLLNKIPLFYSQPVYGDVVVIKDSRLDYSIVKRVIAVEGDRIAIRDGVVFVNDNPLPELYTFGKSQDMEEQTIKNNYIFVAGDNRTPGASLDSRDPQIGQIHISAVRGYAAVSLFPMYRIAKPLKL